MKSSKILPNETGPVLKPHAGRHALAGVCCGAISVQPGIAPKAVACKSTMAGSAVAAQ